MDVSQDHPRMVVLQELNVETICDVTHNSDETLPLLGNFLRPPLKTAILRCSLDPDCDDCALYFVIQNSGRVRSNQLTAKIFLLRLGQVVICRINPGQNGFRIIVANLLFNRFIVTFFLILITILRKSPSISSEFLKASDWLTVELL